MRTLNRALGIVAMLAGAALAAPSWAADEPAAAGTPAGAKAEEGHEEAASDYKHWKAKNEVSNIASLQRGARNFLGYCVGCHSLKYVRYSRMAEDLEIPEAQLEQMMPPGDKPADY